MLAFFQNALWLLYSRTEITLRPGATHPAQQNIKAMPRKLPGALLPSDLNVGDLVLLVDALEDSCEDLVWSNLIALL